jgi:hypothetical protein
MKVLLNVRGAYGAHFTTRLTSRVLRFTVIFKALNDPSVILSGPSASHHSVDDASGHNTFWQADGKFHASHGIRDRHIPSKLFHDMT